MLPGASSPLLSVYGKKKFKRVCLEKLLFGTRAIQTRRRGKGFLFDFKTGTLNCRPFNQTNFSSMFLKKVTGLKAVQYT